MSPKIDQKAYLQKYLSGSSGDKKKKKKKASKGKGFKIIDDDIDLTKLRALEGDEVDILGEGEDAPQIAGIIDDRPEEVKKLEQFSTSSKWRVINQDDGFNSKLQVEEIKQDIKQKEKENELIFGKMYSDSEDEKKNDSDQSPPRKQVNNKKNESPKKPQNHSDKDFSPPRRKDSPKRQKNEKKTDETKGKKRYRNDSGSDLSPPRKGSSNKIVYKNHDSQLSPPRKHENQKRKERVRKPSRWEAEVESKRNKSPVSDMSPVRKSKRDNSPRSKKSPKRRKSSDTDISPPRKSQKVRRKDSDQSPPRKLKRNQSDSDMSPPRKTKHSSDKHKNRNNRRDKSVDSDLSPPRRNRQKSPDRNYKGHHSRDFSPSRRDKRSYRSDSPPPSNKKMERTLEGKKAGLQDARQLKEENETFRRRENEVFSRMNDEVSGRNAQVVSRKGKRETSEERQKQSEKAERQKELDEKYKKWSKGLKQIEARETRAQEYLHEASKPLARFKDDRDLESNLRNVERDGDPMLQYIKERKRERGDLPPEKPSYKGRFPPNRFNIRPGYRWDGVDRSNGYEKKYFDQQSKKKAQQDEAYKWSTEDL